MKTKPIYVLWVDSPHEQALTYFFATLSTVSYERAYRKAENYVKLDPDARLNWQMFYFPIDTPVSVMRLIKMSYYAIVKAIIGFYN